MKQALTALLLLAGLAACRHHPGEQPSPATLVGRWQLTQLDCYCAAAPLPNEVLTFAEDSTYNLMLDKQRINAGVYSTKRGFLCDSTSQLPLLTMSGYSNNSTYYRNGAYTLTSDRLVIKAGSHCVADASVRTYRRLP